MTPIACDCFVSDSVLENSTTEAQRTQSSHRVINKKPLHLVEEWNGLQPIRISSVELFLPSTVLTVSGSRGLPSEFRIANCGFRNQSKCFNPQSEIPNPHSHGTLSLVAPPKAAEFSSWRFEF